MKIENLGKTEKLGNCKVMQSQCQRVARHFWVCSWRLRRCLLGNVVVILFDFMLSRRCRRRAAVVTTPAAAGYNVIRASRSVPIDRRRVFELSINVWVVSICPITRCVSCATMVCVCRRSFVTHGAGERQDTSRHVMRTCDRVLYNVTSYNTN